MDESVKGIVHIFHTQVNFIVGVDLFGLNSHHIFQPHDIFVLQEFWIIIHLLKIFISLRMRFASPRLSKT
jgi:hypothetical protein